MTDANEEPKPDRIWNRPWFGIASVVLVPVAVWNAFSLELYDFGYGIRFTVPALNNVFILALFVLGTRSCWHWLRRSKRILVRLISLLGGGILSVLALPVLFALLLWWPGSWVGDDLLREELSSVRSGWDRYVAVRSNLGAFAGYHVEVRRETDIVPGLLVWSRVVIKPRCCSEAELRFVGDSMQCTFHDVRVGESNSTEMQTATIRLGS